MSPRQRKLIDDPPIPDRVKDETVTVPRGEVTYTFDLDDEEVEQLATGLCPARIAKIAWEALGWKREMYRNEARERASA